MGASTSGFFCDNKRESLKAVEYQKAHYDKNTRERLFRVGDAVIAHYPNIQTEGNKKFTSEWRSGYCITKVISTLNCA